MTSERPSQSGSVREHGVQDRPHLDREGRSPVESGHERAILVASVAAVPTSRADTGAAQPRNEPAEARARRVPPQVHCDHVRGAECGDAGTIPKQAAAHRRARRRAASEQNPSALRCRTGRRPRSVMPRALNRGRRGGGGRPVGPYRSRPRRRNRRNY